MNHPTTLTESRAGRPAAARRPRVLLSAYSCFPNWGSEPGIGWMRATEIAKYCDTWVLTVANETQHRIESYLREHGPIPNLEFVFVRPAGWERALEELPMLNYVAYRGWLRRSFRVARQLHARVGFDLAHHVTYGGYREPSHLYKLGVPFVWGPIGGVQNYPWRFLPGAGLGGAVLESARNIANTIQLWGSPRVRAAARRAAAIFSANAEAQQKLLQVHGVESTLLSDVGAASLAEHWRNPPASNGPLRILWAGRLITRKALELLIEALAMLPPDVAYTLTVIGEGPRRRAWQRLAERRGVSAHIQWRGRLRQEESLKEFRQADVFVFSSLRDTTGTVIVEALAAGTPVICLDHQGAAGVVTAECGIKIPVTTRPEVQRRLSEALVLVYRDREHCRGLGRGARRRAKECLWSLQAQRIALEYNLVLESLGSDARCDVETAARPLDMTPDESSDDAATACVGSLEQ